MMKVVTILSMKQLTPQKVKWKLRKKRGRPVQKWESGSKEWEDDEFFALTDAWSGIEQHFNCKDPKYHLRDE